MTLHHRRDGGATPPVRGTFITRKSGISHRKGRGEAGARPGWGVTAACLAVSTVLGICAAALAGTLVRQIREMAGELDDGKYRRGVTGVMQGIQRDRRLVAAGGVLGEFARGGTPRIDPMAVTTQDPGNGLYAYLVLLVRLREAEAGAASRPEAHEEKIAAAMRDALAAGPVRLYLTRQRSMAEAALAEAGFSERESAALAKGLLSRGNLRVVRELVQRLAATARSWEASGRRDDARTAQRCAARLMADIVTESPVPEVMLLASAELPEALRAMGEAEAAERAGAARVRWHEAIGDDDVNLLPRTGEAVLAKAEERRVLSAMLASGVLAGTWGTLVVVCAVLSIAMAWGRERRRGGVEWRWKGWGRWGAAGVTLLPAGVLLIAIWSVDVPFVWVLSAPTTPSAAGLPLVLVILLAGVTRGFIRPASSGASAFIPLGAATAFIGLVGLVWVGGFLFLPTLDASWRPPPVIQLIRQLGAWAGIVSGVLIVVWVVWGEVRRRRREAAWGLGAQAMLHVGSAALLMCSMTLVAALGVNARFDRQHGQTFARASTDPVGEVLGEGWMSRYFDAARRAVE